MKIGILSMQKIHNYGSFLQALSLKKQMEIRNHDVYFIDILPGKQIIENTHSKSSMMRKFDKYFFKRIENYFLHKKMAKIHINDYKTYLETDKVLNNDCKFDAVIIGSDEVFNATANSSWGFSTQLFGDIYNAKRIISYAASCGSTTFADALKYNIVDEIKNSLLNLSDISVRDQNTFDFVKSISGRDALIHLDPVFLSDFDNEIIINKRRRPYILIYAYSNRINDKKEITAIKEFAKENKLDILCVGMQQRWCKNNISASAFELLGYVKEAKYIITDTFHGAVFSIKYNKKFCVFLRDSNSFKLGGLLAKFNLCSRVVCENNTLASIMSHPIDYQNVNKTILEEQEKSKIYLDSVFGGRK